MAIINSLAIGKSVKSAGNLTYKTVRGRTIASQRITQNKSNTFKQANQRASFGISSQSMVLFQKWIDSCYEKSKFGSARNTFLKENRKYNLGGLLGEVKEGIVPYYEGFVLGIDRGVGGEYKEGSARFSAFGSSSYVVTQEVTKNNSVTINENMYNILTTTESTFVLTTPLKRQDVVITLCGFFLTSGVTTTNAALQVKNLSLSNEDVVKMKALGLIANVVEVDGFVESVSFKADSAAAQNLKSSLFVAFPKINGKIPTLRSWFFVEPTPGS